MVAAIDIIEEMLSAHADYITNALDTLRDGIGVPADIDRARLDNVCRIGVWLETIAEAYADNADFLKVCATHSKFHNDLANLIAKYHGGERDAVIAKLEALGLTEGGCFIDVLDALTRFASEVDDETSGLF